MSRVLISAAHKSSGKTTVSIGLAAALRARGLAVQPFKKGPDYIDPMWLTAASARACRNLDFYLMDRREIRAAFMRHAADADLALIEGNKGLHDGLDLDGSDSNAALAVLLAAPVVLVIDARGMTRGVAPLVLGYQAFDPDVRIAGVILNHVGGPRHEAKLRAAIERYANVPVIGAVRHDPRLQIPERHLGLVPSNEADEAERTLSVIGERVVAQVDLDALVALAASAPPLLPGGALVAPPAVARLPRVRIGIARDRAFGFYYPDDLEALHAAGAELVPVSLINDASLPALDGLFIGGGFPELFMRELEANRTMRECLRDAIEGDLPVYAECGGLMYLARSITWKGATHAMAGAIPGDVVVYEKPVGRGYVRLEETGRSPWPRLGAAVEVLAHEFHYSTLENLAPGCEFAYRVLRGHGIDGAHDGLVYRNLLASYTHLRSVQRYNWAERFVALAQSVAQGATALRRRASG